jgi:hypothetical protein
MLSDPAEETHWPNIVGVLGMIGDERVVSPLITFLESNVEGTLSPAHYRAKSSVPMVLGYVVNNTGSEELLEYLIASRDPDVWMSRGLAWRSPFHAEASERNLQLSTNAIWGLALSGQSAAADALRSLQEPGGTEAAMRLRAKASSVISEALEVHATVADVGLEEYYRSVKR